jgi:hypothetical protein
VAEEWQDLSGNGNHLTKTSGKTFPTIGSGVASFNGSSDMLDVPINMSGWTAGEIFLLQRRYADNGDAGLNTGFMRFGTRGDALQSHFAYSGTIYSGFGRNTRRTVGNPTPAIDLWHVCNIISAASDWRYYMDEELQDGTISNTVSFPTNGNIGGEGTLYFQGDIKGIALFNRKLTSLERAQVRGWLASL